MTPADERRDLSPARIAAAVGRIHPAFLNTPQFVSQELSAALGRQLVIKNETRTPIGSFKGRGTWLLAKQLDPAKTWVCSTAGNFGQGLANAARAHGATVEAFVSEDVPEAKVTSMRALGACVQAAGQPGQAARDYVAGSEDRLLVLDGLRPEMAEGAGTIALELEALGPIDLAIVQVGDGALVSGIACWLRHARPRTRVVGVCAIGAPAMARSFQPDASSRQKALTRSRPRSPPQTRSQNRSPASSRSSTKSFSSTTTTCDPPKNSSSTR